MYPFVTRPDTALTFQNMPFENQDYMYPFNMKPENEFTLQNMSSENQDL